MADDPRFSTQPGTGKLDPTKLPQEQQILWLSHEMERGIDLMRADVARIFAEIGNGMRSHEKRIETIESSHEQLREEHIGRCAETRMNAGTLTKIVDGQDRVEAALRDVSRKIEDIYTMLSTHKSLINKASDKADNAIAGVELLRDELERWLRETWGSWLPWLKGLRWFAMGIGGVLLTALAVFVLWGLSRSGAGLP